MSLLPLRSLSIRVTLLIVSVITILLIVFNLSIQSAIRHHFRGMDFGEIEVIAESVSSIIDASHNSAELIENLPRAVSGHHGVYYLVMDKEGRVLYQSHGIELNSHIRSLPVRESARIEFLQDWRDGENYFVGTKIKHYSKLTGQEYAIAVVISTDSHAQFLNSLDKKSWWMVMIAITIAATLTILVVRFGHRPLYRIARTLRDISTNNLDRRLALKDAPQELVPVIKEINDMLQRLEASYERLSHYSADIAHELKTPVNNLMTQVQVILSRDRPVENYKETLYSALEECEHMAQMITDLLFLAKADDLSHSLDLKPVPIKIEIENMIDYYAPLAEERHISFEVNGQDIEVIAEPGLLRRVFANLYANAIRYADPNSQITTRIKVQDSISQHQILTIEIENQCPDLSSKDLARLFDRFYRVRNKNDNTKWHAATHGSGLGLAISRSIIELHRGDIRVSSKNGSTCFRIELPVKS